MNDIIKVILLNFILIYFLIKKNKSISIFLIVVLFIFLIYLRSKKLLEGQSSVSEKKDEVKFMKMANLDKLLGKLLNVYEHSEEDCIGGYTDFTPCDKKCGITHKYKTYRVKRPAGLFGKSCVEEDGRRKKELCDESDGIYKCIIGESCQEDGDCDSNNCDPKTNRCVPERVCSNTNLDLCNKEECIDLNNHYDYAKREFKYDEAESGIKCKLEDKETDSEDEEEEEDDRVQGGLDPSIIAAADCETNQFYWYLEPQDRGEYRVTSTGCKLKIPGSVFYESEDSSGFQERKKKYGINDLDPGLYCKIGYKFCPDQSTGVEGDENSQPEETDDQEGGGDETDICSTLDDMVGISSPILPEYISGISSRRLSNYCTSKIDRSECPPGAWPPYSYFERNRNPESYDENLTIPIIDRCKRCDNGWYKPEGGGECTQCMDESNRPVETINQYKLVENDYINIEDGSMGNNTSCLEYGDADSLTCENSGYQCEYRNMIRDDTRSPDNTTINSLNEFWGTCCKKCPNNQKFLRDPNSDDVCTETDCCSPCPPGQKQSSAGNECVDCTAGSMFSPADDNGTCSKCSENMIVSDSGDNCLPSLEAGESCSDWDLLNGRCQRKEGRPTICNSDALENGGIRYCSRVRGDRSQNRRSTYLDARSQYPDREDTELPTYNNCCEFKGCPAGVHARVRNNITSELECENCPDLCGVEITDSSNCRCAPMTPSMLQEMMTSRAGISRPVPLLDDRGRGVGEWNIGNYDGTWIFFVPTRVLQGSISSNNQADYVSTLDLIGRLNGTIDEPFNWDGGAVARAGWYAWPEYFMPRDGAGHRASDRGDTNWYKWNQWKGGSDYQMVGGEWYYPETFGRLNVPRTPPNKYTARYTYTGGNTNDEFYNKIWNDLKDKNVFGNMIVRETAIAIFLTKQDICNYCQSNKLVIYKMKWFDPEWATPAAAGWSELNQFSSTIQLPIIIDFSGTTLDSSVRHEICKYCAPSRVVDGGSRGGYRVPQPDSPPPPPAGCILPQPPPNTRAGAPPSWNADEWCAAYDTISDDQRVREMCCGSDASSNYQGACDYCVETDPDPSR